MAVDAWVAEVVVRVVRAEVAPLPADWREVLAELVATRGQVRRVGVLLNQIAAHAHATGTVPEAARRVAGMADRVVRRLDELTEQAEILAVDFWLTLEGLNDHYGDATAVTELDDALAGPPTASAWEQVSGFSEW